MRKRNRRFTTLLTVLLAFVLAAVGGAQPNLTIEPEVPQSVITAQDRLAQAGALQFRNVQIGKLSFAGGMRRDGTVTTEPYEFKRYTFEDLLAVGYRDGSQVDWHTNRMRAKERDPNLRRATITYNQWVWMGFQVRGGQWQYNQTALRAGAQPFVEKEPLIVETWYKVEANGDIWPMIRLVSIPDANEECGNPTRKDRPVVEDFWAKYPIRLDIIPQVIQGKDRVVTQYETIKKVEQYWIYQDAPKPKLVEAPKQLVYFPTEARGQVSTAGVENRSFITTGVSGIWAANGSGFFRLAKRDDGKPGGPPEIDIPPIDDGDLPPVTTPPNPWDGPRDENGNPPPTRRGGGTPT